MMQTFLPSTSFEQSAKWLDNQRLGKQRVEVLQILKALTEPDYGWQNHPAVKMWRGYISALALYGLTICNEWIARGYKDTCYDKINPYLSYDQTIGINYSDWLTEEFASNHRSILLGKALEKFAITGNRFDVAVAMNNLYPSEKTPKELKKAEKAYHKALEVLNFYQLFNWSEQPVQRVNGKWPYIWPVK